MCKSWPSLWPLIGPLQGLFNFREKTLPRRSRSEMHTTRVPLECPGYFRDVEGREVDFVVARGRVPRLLVECKGADAEVDRSLR